MVGMATPATPIRTGRLRRRLTIAFVMVGGLSAGALALGSYLVVRHDRLDESASRALQDSRLNTLIARATLHGRQGDIGRLEARFATRGTFATVIGTDGRVPPGGCRFRPTCAGSQTRARSHTNAGRSPGCRT